MQQAPVLSWLAAIAALATLGIQQVGVPLLGDPARLDALRRMSRAGDFMANLTAMASLVALAITLHAFVRQNHVVALPRRLLLAGLSGVLLPTFVVATLLERSRTTLELVLFALGAAYAVIALVHASVAGLARTRLGRVLSGLVATTATAALGTQGLQTLSRTELDPWIERGHTFMHGVTEIGHLVTLLLVAIVALPHPTTGRDRFARLAAGLVLPLLLGTFYLAERSLGRELGVVLYDAQRVRLFVDAFPRLYAIPIALALAGALGGALSSDDNRRQAGAAAVLIVASGCAPLAPGRLLTLTLGLLLLARVTATREARIFARATPGTAARPDTRPSRPAPTT